MLPLLTVALVSLAAVGALNAWLAGRHARLQIERQLQGVAAVLAESNFPLTDAVLRQMKDLSSAEFVLADRGGRSIAASFEGPAPVFSNVRPAAQLRDIALGPPVSLGGSSYFHASIDLAARARVRPAQTLHILFPQSEYRRTWREAVVPPLAVGLGTVAAVAVITHLVAGRISRGAKRVGGEVLRLAQGDYSPMASPATDDEIRDLALAVNRTAEMLADYERELRRTEQIRTVAMMGASLAHELRNSATGCRMALDLYAESCNGHGEGESLSVARRQLTLMERQLRRFLDLSKGESTGKQRVVDLAELVDEALALVRPAAQHAKVQLRWTPPGGPMAVRVDEEGFAQAVLNLLLNALDAAQQEQHTSGDGLPWPRIVEVVLAEHGEQGVELLISDNGPGPSDGVAGTMFEPFVTSKAEGAGLGLAAARQTIEACGGKITWQRENDMTRFRVWTPRANPADAGGKENSVGNNSGGG